MGVAAHQSESGDHFVNGNLQGSPVYSRALFLLLIRGVLGHISDGEGGGREREWMRDGRGQ